MKAIIAILGCYWPSISSAAKIRGEINNPLIEKDLGAMLRGPSFYRSSDSSE